MLYNVPNEKFGDTYQKTWINCFNHIVTADHEKVVCANHMHWLVRQLADFLASCELQHLHGRAEEVLGELIGTSTLISPVVSELRCLSPITRESSVSASDRHAAFDGRRASAFGAERNRVTLSTDFLSPPENGHSRYSHPTARFAPFQTYAQLHGRSARGGKLPFPICPACDAHGLKAVIYRLKL